MKKSFSRIWGVGLVLVMLGSLLFSAVPVAADELAWGTYSLPGTSSNILVQTTGADDIVDLAVSSDGNTIYAAANADGTPDALLYKSTNGGKTWSLISQTALPATLLRADFVAVAPDDANYVVVADATALVVAASTNGGSTWSDLAFATGTAIYDLDISSLTGSTRYVAVASTTGANLPKLYYFNLGSAVPAWVDAVAGTGWTSGIAATIDTIRAVAFSPNFASDLVAVAVSEDLGATGAMRAHILSFNQKKWDSTAGFTGYPFAIKSSVGGAFAVNNAEISLDPSYLGGDDSLRVAFVGASITDTTEVGGIFRLKDTSVKALLETTGIKSVSWNSVNLVAGPTASNQTRYSADALATSPTVSSSSVLKRPGLDGTSTAAVVAWAGANVVGGVSGNGSAFAISTDNGKTFNDVSLIDATLTNIRDLLVVPDGSKVYFISSDAVSTSLWVKTDAWYRIWQNATAPTTAYIARGAPDNKDVLYIADRGGTNMWFTDNGGMTKWFPRASRYAIQDLALESIDVAYVGTTGTTVSKTTNKGFTWGDEKSASLGAGNVYSITVIAKDQLLVGSTGGYVSYSFDGNANWTKIDKLITGGGNVVATASSLDTGGYIYVAQDVGATLVQRWQIGTSTALKDLVAGTPANTATEAYGATGIKLSEGVLYVLINDNTGAALDSRILRTVGPTGDAPTWSTSTIATGADTDLGPTALRASIGSTTLWAVDTFTPAIYTFQDTLTTAKVVLAGPADGGKVSVNLISGNVYSISFSWNRPSKATIYDLQVALDSSFNETLTVGTSPITSTSATIASSPTLTLNPDTKYYWRVRVNSAGPIQSNWSDVRSFTIAGATPPPVVTITPAPPAPPAPIINLPAPVINLPAPTTITIPPAPIITIPPAPAPPAPIAPAYIWAVVIIGAVLVIAVIILIVRTRRPV